ISELMDQLDQPWSSLKVVRVLRNYLRPEIRHEILNLDIKAVSELREICRRREAFLADIKLSQGYVRSTSSKREVSEFRIESKNQSEKEVEALSLVFWNCRMEGHRYQDCVSERSVFCYGFGAANTYKPSCARCSKNPQHGTQKLPPKKKTSSAVRSQATMTD
ncbi:hypothetical protein KR026_009974, partial [Drosophila bipectinata]